MIVCPAGTAQKRFAALGKSIIPYLVSFVHIASKLWIHFFVGASPLHQDSITLMNSFIALKLTK
jgi:hypothetical protein